MNFFLFSLIVALIIQPINVIRETLLFAKQQAQLSSIKKNKSILLLGDSLAEGMTSTFYKLAKQYGYNSISNCRRGSGIQYWSSRIEKIILQNKPALTLISLGTNDAGTPSPEAQRKHIKNIKNIAIKNNVRILWILPQRLPAHFHNQDAIKRIIIEEFGDDVLDTSIELEKTSDRIHPTREGYESWMNIIWQQLVERKMLIKN